MDLLRNAIADGTMTQQLWDKTPLSVRRSVRDNSGLVPALLGLEGCRVETMIDGKQSRFKVGVSAGWRPCHIRLHDERSIGGEALSADMLTGVVAIVRRACDGY